jgi:hypothetical protein
MKKANMTQGLTAPNNASCLKCLIQPEKLLRECSFKSTANKKLRKTMKNISEIESKSWLKPWQRKMLIVIGAIAGGVATHVLLRWMERRNGKRAVETAETASDVH